MRSAFLASLVAHLLLIVVAIVRLEPGNPFETAEVAALPVELVTIAQETDVTVGDSTAEVVVEDAAPETVEADAASDRPGASGNEADRIATQDDARADGPLSSAPEPEAAPEPLPAPQAEPVEAAEPTEVATLAEPEATPEAEAAPAEQAEAEPEPQPEPEDAEPAPQRTPVTAVPVARPPVSPSALRRQVARTRQTFDADRLSELINRTDATGGGAGRASASIGSETGRAAAALTLSEKDALRSQMQRCWSPPIGLASGEVLAVTVQIRLDPDGSVGVIQRINPRYDALYNVAADAAERAVLQCQPYRLPPQKYEQWKDVQVTFDPRDLF